MSRIENNPYSDSASQARTFTFPLYEHEEVKETAVDQAVKKKASISISEERWALWRQALDDYSAKRNEYLRNHFEEAKQAELDWAKAEYEKSGKSNEEKVKYETYVEEIRNAAPNSSLLNPEHYFSHVENRLLTQKAAEARKYEHQIFNRMKEIFNEAGYRVVKRCTSSACNILNQKLGLIIDKNGQWFIDKEMSDHLSREQRKTQEHTQPPVRRQAFLRSSSWD